MYYMPTALQVVALIETRCPVRVTLTVAYPESYPEVLPDLSIEPHEACLEESDVESLTSQMKSAVRF